MKQFVKKNVISSRDSQSVEIFMKKIAKFPLLNPEQEAELAEKIKNGDQRARECMINSNLRFVITVAHAYQGMGIPLEDLISEGCIGLQKAVDYYDATKGFRFCSYAVWWIRQSISKAVSAYAQIVRIPSNRQTLINRVVKTQTELMQKLMRTPTLAEIAEKLDMEEAEVESILCTLPYSVSLDKSISSKDDAPLWEQIPLQGSETDSEMTKDSLRQDIAEMMSGLNEMEKYIINRCYGLGYPNAISMGEIALQLNLSQERVRQIHNKALERLRTNNKTHQLFPHLATRASYHSPARPHRKTNINVDKL